MPYLTGQQAVSLLAHIADLTAQLKEAKEEAATYRGWWLALQQEVEAKEDDF